MNKREIYGYVFDKSHITLQNIKESVIQQQYREYLAGYRDIDEKVLEDAFMFYVMHGEMELDEIIPDLQMKYSIDLMRDFIIQKERFVFPILSPNRTINGLVGYDYESDFKYILSISNFTSRDNLLFNLNNIKHAYEQDTIIVCEGVFDSLRLNEVGLKNNVALLGRRLTNYKKKIINRFGLVILLPDNDSVGTSALSFWKREINTKLAIVNLSSGVYDKNIIKQNEDGELITEVVESKIKDIDDFLREKNNSNKENFLNLYGKIKGESGGVFFKEREYFI